MLSPQHKKGSRTMNQRQQKIQAHIFNMTGICPVARSLTDAARELLREVNTGKQTNPTELLGMLEDATANLQCAKTQQIEASDALCVAAWRWRLAFMRSNGREADAELRQQIALLKGAVVAARSRDIRSHETPVLMAYLAGRFEARDNDGGYCDARR